MLTDREWLDILAAFLEREIEKQAAEFRALEAAYDATNDDDTYVHMERADQRLASLRSELSRINDELETGPWAG